MKRINFKGHFLLVFCVVAGILSCSETKEKSQENTNAYIIFPKGEKISNNNFTGTAWLKTLVNADSVNQIAVGSVTFEPGARTKWHSHPAGQIILALDGIGYYQEKGQQKKVLRKGDVIKCSPDIPHWHGASVDTAFVQVAITGREKGETVWLEFVTDKEYNSRL
ncbi:cupin domain-containing protein [Niabella soli]|uniref:Cupin n=1 Tax=Niabella soli DSM 19437 TaxID=929713 RepID=W0EVK8_9BACT|nr:cupin domain-containing protein [Niabella soli]AHF14840.1 cupin [Niabella soli DSM 19437]